MSSKVLRGRTASELPALAWKALPAPGQQPPAQPQQARGAASAPAPGPPEPTKEDVARACEARIAELERSFQALERQAFDAGVKKGEAAGEDRERARLQPLTEKLAATAQELSRNRREIRRQAEEDVVQLALAIARRIVRRELSVDSSALLGIVRAALDKLDARDIDRIRVHPDDAPAMQAYIARANLPGKLTVQADPGLERGGAIFETSRGELDASVDSQLNELQRGLCDRLKA